MKKAYDVKKSLLLALPLLFGSVAHAEKWKPNPNDVTEYGSNITCPFIIESLKSDDKVISGNVEYAIRYYTLGYLTSSNISNYALLAGHPPEHLGSNINFEYNIEYVKNYCLNNPKSSLPDAVMTLVGNIK